MAAGPIHIAGSAMIRTIGPLAAGNPFNGGLLSWIGDPSNTWYSVSYVLVAIILGMGAWLLHSSIAFIKTQTFTALGVLILFGGCMLVLSEGGKYDPTDWRETMTAAMFGLALLSTCGKYFAFAETDDRKKKK